MDSTTSIKLQTSAYAAFLALLIIWVVHVIATMFDIELGWLGILPRQLTGIKGIFLAPLVHDDFEHLFYNSLPLPVLVGMISYFYRKVALKSISMMYILTGFAVWLFARQVYHIGASGVVYAMVSFVFFSGIFRQNVKSIILALIVTILYSGMVTGIFDIKEGVSWESHLFGALVGLYVAYFYKNEIEKDDESNDSPWVRRERFVEEEGQYFLDRDTFDMTKAERAAQAEKLNELKRQREAKAQRSFNGWTSDDTGRG